MTAEILAMAKRDGFDLGPGVSCDLSTLVDTRLLVQANSGGGKSWCLRRILEQTHGRIQHLVIDPEGEFSSLRERCDYVLAARQGGDTAADPRSAKLLAERLLELGVSAILDIYELKAHERIRFVRHFLEALVDAPKTLWHPALVIVDEAHVYCPEKGQAESAGAVIDLATRGRKRGYCAILATQRLSKLHKDAAAECNNKLIGRTGLDIDMDRAGEELGFPKGRRHELRELREGHFFAFGPAISRAVTTVHVGAVATTHPKAGARLAFSAPPPTEKVRALLPKLADLPAEAEARERTAQDLKAEVTRLKRELADATRDQPATTVERVEVPILHDAQIARLETLFQEVGKLQARFQPLLAEVYAPITAQCADILTALKRAPLTPPVRATMHLSPTARPETRQALRQVATAAARQIRTGSVGAAAIGKAERNGLTGPERRILDAIAWLESLGIDAPEQVAVAFLAGYTFGGGAFNNPRGALRQQGFVEYVGSDRIRLTDAGRSVATFPESVLSADELQARVLARLPGPEQRLLRPLLDAYPKALTNEQLAAKAGYTPNAGAYNNPRGRLRTLGLIEYPQPGSVVAKSLLFLE